MKIGDRVIVVNENSGLFGKIGLIVQHPLRRLFSQPQQRKDKKLIFVKFGKEIVSMGRFEVAKIWSK